MPGMKWIEPIVFSKSSRNLFYRRTDGRTDGRTDIGVNPVYPIPPSVERGYNNVTKDRCSIQMDTTVMLGPLKFKLRATIDHHGPSIHSGDYTASINCCEKKHSIATTTKTPLLHMLYFINWLHYEFWTRTGGWEFHCSHGAGTSSPSY